MASRDFLAVYRDGAMGKDWRKSLDAFMARWFAGADGRFPGYGREYGKCASRANCERALIPGEPGYQVAATLGDQVVQKLRDVGTAVKDGVGAAGASLEKAASSAAAATKRTGQKAVEGGKKLLKKLF